MPTPRKTKTTKNPVENHAEATDPSGKLYFCSAASPYYVNRPIPIRQMTEQNTIPGKTKSVGDHSPSRKGRRPKGTSISWSCRESRRLCSVSNDFHKKFHKGDLSSRVKDRPLSFQARRNISVI